MVGDRLLLGGGWAGERVVVDGGRLREELVVDRLVGGWDALLFVAHCVWRGGSGGDGGVGGGARAWSRVSSAMGSGV